MEPLFWRKIPENKLTIRKLSGDQHLKILPLECWTWHWFLNPAVHWHKFAVNHMILGIHLQKLCIPMFNVTNQLQRINRCSYQMNIEVWTLKTSSGLVKLCTEIGLQNVDLELKISRLVCQIIDIWDKGTIFCGFFMFRNQQKAGLSLQTSITLFLGISSGKVHP